MDGLVIEVFYSQHRCRSPDQNMGAGHEADVFYAKKSLLSILLMLLNAMRGFAHTVSSSFPFKSPTLHSSLDACGKECL